MSDTSSVTSSLSLSGETTVTNASSLTNSSQESLFEKHQQDDGNLCSHMKCNLKSGNGAGKKTQDEGTKTPRSVDEGSCLLNALVVAQKDGSSSPLAKRLPVGPTKKSKMSVLSNSSLRCDVGVKNLRSGSNTTAAATIYDAFLTRTPVRTGAGKSDTSASSSSSVSGASPSSTPTAYSDNSNAEGQQHAHVTDPVLLEPYAYISQNKGKNVRGMLLDSFNRTWLGVDDGSLAVIKSIVSALHNSSLLVDDIEDGSQLRRGAPAAHMVFGVPATLNCANYVYFMALQRTLTLQSPLAMAAFVEEMLSLHRGQGFEIHWRDHCLCPTEAEYESMVLDKTGGLFRMAVKLIMAVRDDQQQHQHNNSQQQQEQQQQLGSDGDGREECRSSGGGTRHPHSHHNVPPSGLDATPQDYIPLVNQLSLYFQIRDDYVNLASAEYMKKKDFCEDLSEGKFSFPIIHCIRNDPLWVPYVRRQRKQQRKQQQQEGEGEERSCVEKEEAKKTDGERETKEEQQEPWLLSVLRRRPADEATKRAAVERMRRAGSLTYTRRRLNKVVASIRGHIAALGGNKMLSKLVDRLHIAVLRAEEGGSTSSEDKQEAKKQQQEKQVQECEVGGDAVGCACTGEEGERAAATVILVKRKGQQQQQQQQPQPQQHKQQSGARGGGGAATSAAVAAVTAATTAAAAATAARRQQQQQQQQQQQRVAVQS